MDAIKLEVPMPRELQRRLLREVFGAETHREWRRRLRATNAILDTAPENVWCDESGGCPSDGV